MSTSGDRLPSTIGTKVSLRDVVGARRRLDELGTARLVGEAAELVHKAQLQGQPLATLCPEAIVIRGGKVALELPTAAIALAYSAPERLRGATGDRRTDVFSLGVILWEALAHVRLFDRPGDVAIRDAVLAFAPRPASEHNANVPAELDAICKKALARDPADRYQSAKVMAAEIAAVLDDAGYPETNDAIVAWIAGEFPQPTANQPIKPRDPLGSQTVMGMAPLRIEPQPMPSSPGEKLVAALASAPATPRSAKPTPGAPLAPAVIVDDPEIVALETRKTAEPQGRAQNDTILDPKPLVEMSGSATLTGMAALTVAPADPTPAPSLPAVIVAPLPVQAARPSAIGATTVILGSPASAPATPPTPEWGRTAFLGSNAIIEATNAAVSAANPPRVEPPAILQPAASIANAPTVATPAVRATRDQNAPGAALAPTAGAFRGIDKRSEETGGADPTGSAGGARGRAPREIEPPNPASASNASPASSVDQQSAPELPTRSRRPTTGKHDVLAGWGWGTDAHESIQSDDDTYADDRKRSKKYLFIAIGGAAVAALLVTIIAVAVGGDNGTKPVVAETQVVAPPEPPKPEPSTPEPAQPEPAKPPPQPEPAKVEPAKPEPANPEPAKVEPAKPEPAKLEPTKLEPAKPEPAKPEPAKPEPVKPAKPEPAKLSPAKPEPAKPEPVKPAKPPKHDPPKVAKPEPKKPTETKPLVPVDPYVPKLDAATAYKTGLQQFARGDAGGALATFKTSLATDPGFAPTWRGIGLVYEKLGKKSQASTAFKQYLRLNPNAGDAEQIRTRLERL